MSFLLVNCSFGVETSEMPGLDQIEECDGLGIRIFCGSSCPRVWRGLGPTLRVASGGAAVSCCAPGAPPGSCIQGAALSFPLHDFLRRWFCVIISQTGFLIKATFDANVRFFWRIPLPTYFPHTPPRTLSQASF